MRIESELAGLGYVLPEATGHSGHYLPAVRMGASLGASDLFARLYGERGLHARSAIGVSVQIRENYGGFRSIEPSSPRHARARPGSTRASIFLRKDGLAGQARQ
jgi:hypothetical protein